MAGDNLSDRGDRAGDSKAGELTRVIDGASKSAMNEVLDAWGPPPTSKSLFEKASDFVSHLSMESLPALSTDLFKRVTSKTEGQDNSKKQIKETGEKPEDKPTKHIYQSVEIEALAKKGDPVAIDTVKMLEKVGDNKDWRTIIKEAYTNVVTQFKNFITGGGGQLQEVPQVISASLDTVNETRFEAKMQEDLKPTSTDGKSPDELIVEAKFTYNADDQGHGSDSLPAITGDSSKQLEGHITKVGHIENNPLGWLKAAQKIAQLPFDKQLQVIGAGLSSGVNEYNYQYRERSIGALIGTVQGVGTLATNLGKVADFSAYLLLNDHERAGQMGAEFGEALGTSIVGGVRLFEGAHHYLNDVGKAGYEGDYTKVFRDIDNLGKHLDKAWSELPPREQSRIISKLGTELAGDGLIGLGAAKAAGKLPGQFTKILDTISNDAQKLHRAGKNITEKSVRAIDEAVEPLVDIIRKKMGPREAFAGAYHEQGGFDAGKAIEGITKPIDRAIESIDKALEKPLDELSNFMAPYFEWGKKHPVKRSRAAEVTGMEGKDITKLVKKNPDALEQKTGGKLIYMQEEYRDMYLKAHPQYMGIDESFGVHHKIPQRVLQDHPHLFTHKEIHNPKNLVGIPDDTGTHQKITNEWEDFFLALRQQRKPPTRQQVIDFANHIDQTYSKDYLP